MARMPDFEADIRRDLGDDLASKWDRVEHGLRKVEDAASRMREHMYPHLHHGAPQPAAEATQAPASEPVTITETPKESHMSLATDLRNVADRVDRLGEEVVGKVETVVATPAGAAGLDLLHALTGLNIDQAIVAKALGGLEALLQAYAPDPAPAPAEPAAPAPAQ